MKQNWISIILITLSVIGSFVLASMTSTEFDLTSYIYSKIKKCEVGDHLTCYDKKVCAKIDASGNTRCLTARAESPMDFILPIDETVEVICTQSPENAKGTHGFSNMLYAIDLTTPYDHPPATIRASADGKAFVFAECKTPMGKPEKSETDNCGVGFGNHVRILHANGIVSFYAHLEKVFIKSGDIVKAGDPIGIEGWTGLAGHRHLHWDVNRLYGSSTEVWEKTLNEPGSGGASIPYRFKVLVDGKEQMISSRNLKCIWDDMTQARWRGTKSF